jgi:hypothetical protein
VNIKGRMRETGILTITQGRGMLLTFIFPPAWHTSRKISERMMSILKKANTKRREEK